MGRLNEIMIEDFKTYLVSEEKSEATIEKYIRDLGLFRIGFIARFNEKVVAHLRIQLSGFSPHGAGNVSDEWVFNCKISKKLSHLPDATGFLKDFKIEFIVIRSSPYSF